jgi:spore germination protein YaaH
MKQIGAVATAPICNLSFPVTAMPGLNHFLIRKVEFSNDDKVIKCYNVSKVQCYVNKWKGMGNKMDRRIKTAFIGSAIAIILILILVGVAVVKFLTPSKEKMSLTEYYEVGESEVLVILQNEVYEKKGQLLNGAVYIDYDTVLTYFNHRFYWDSNEKILTYTTPDEIIQSVAGSKKYTVTKSMIKTDMETELPMVEVVSGQVYLSIDFVQKYSDMTYEYYENPSRVVIQYLWGEYLYTEVTKDTQLRTEANIKSPILSELKPGTALQYIDTEEVPQKGFIKVMTADGIRGYVKSKYTREAEYQKLESSFVPPVYTSQTRPGSVNMVFHQVFNTDAADKLEGLIANTSGVTVVSPTWFSINDNSGTISSLATERYVVKAKELGLEVWALVDDFSTEINMKELLSYTSRRETLSNALIEAALQYKLNGINIDFEKIPSKAGKDYIEFLRELSVKCRNNGIVLSVDSYVPSAYTEYYDRTEQGKIVDYVVVMAYDEFYAGSEVAGPVSSIGFVKDAVSNILTMVPKEKTIIAIPFYTRLWKESTKGEVSSESYGMGRAAKVLEDNGVEPKWSDTYGCYYGEFVKEDATYKMWLEEEKSIEEKLKVISAGGVAGIAEWKLGLEKTSIWNVITPYLN